MAVKVRSKLMQQCLHSNQLEAVLELEPLNTAVVSTLNTLMFECGVEAHMTLGADAFAE